MAEVKQALAAYDLVYQPDTMLWFGINELEVIVSGHLGALVSSRDPSQSDCFERFPAVMNDGRYL